MFLPGVPLRVKLVGIAVLAILSVSLVGTILSVVNQGVAAGNGQTRVSRQEAAGFAGSPRQASDESAVISGFKFACPFH